MKKILISLLAMALCLAVMPSCEKTPEPQPPTPEQPGDDPTDDPTAPVFVLTATLDEALDGLFSWDAADAVTAWSVSADGQYGYADYSERDVVAAQVDGAAAKFNFIKLPQGGKTWIAYKSNSGYDGCSAMKIEFNHTSAYTQAQAGVLPHDMVKLISSEVEVPVLEGEESGNTELSAELKLAGTILKNVVTSSKGTYADESVLSVRIASNTEFLCGTGASAYAYNMLDGGKYWMNNDGNTFGDVCTLIWDNTSKSITTTVAEPASVSAGKAVFMPAPPVKVGGYKITVGTDLASYTFDFSMQDITFADGNVTTMNLDLDAENVTRLGNDEIIGSLHYVGSIGDTFKFAPDVTSGEIGYWYAQTQDNGSAEWVTREHSVAENVPFYSGVVFTVIDDATGAESDWFTVKYRNGNTWWDFTATENTSAEPRTATVTATFPDALRYAVVDECKTKVLKVTQDGAGAKKVVTYASVGLPASVTLPLGSAYTDYDVGYCLMAINGVEDRNWGGLYSRMTFKCVSEEDAAAGNYTNEVDWLSCRYMNNGTAVTDCRWWISTTENTGDAPRTAVVVALFPEDEQYEFPEPHKLVVTQPSGQDNTIYDPNSSANMWRTMTVEEMFCYYAPGWSPIWSLETNGPLTEGDLFEADGNTYKFKMASATYERWQAQFAFRTNMSSSADKTYDFYCVINSNKDIASATVKLVKTGDDGNFYFDMNPVKLQAGTDCVVKMPRMQGKDMDKISLFFDFGGNPAETEVTVRDIIFQEHQE